LFTQSVGQVESASKELFIDGNVASSQKSNRDLGFRAVECLADNAPALVLD
jgi:hypothetical protein